MMNLRLPATPRYLRELTRDKSDTLLLLAACSSILIPHTQHLPLWGSLSCAILLLWRAVNTLAGYRLPPRWLLLPVSAFCMLGIYLEYHSFVGKDAGVAMLSLLLTCKLLEMHARRDLFVVLFLGLFLLLAEFFYSQTLATAVISSLSLLLLLTAQLSFQYANTSPPLWQRVKLGLQILGLAIPLSLVAFLFFPRIQGPLWGQPNGEPVGSSGLSDSMSPGSISNLSLSDDIAFRVKFQDSIPARDALYWRGVVLDRFDGVNWTTSPDPRARREIHYNYSGSAVHQEITLEPNGQHWLFALDLPVMLPKLEGSASSVTPALELRSAKAINQRLHYEVNSQVHYQLQADAELAQRTHHLELPPDYDPMTQALAVQLRHRFSDDRRLINEVLRFFNQGRFNYSLDIPKLGKDSTDDFLFKTKTGFCEHYASAFVLLMRGANIPARVVTGYQGGAQNPVDKLFTVRQSDAHAWAEVWLPTLGWVRIDPTAAVAPERVQQNLFAATHKNAWGSLVNIAIGQASWFWDARQNWEALNNTWNQWVQQYNQSKQQSLLNTLGISGEHVSWAILLLVSIGLLATGLTALPLFFSRQRIAPADRLYLRFCRCMQQNGYAKLPHEGPLAYSQRLKTLHADCLLSTQQFLLVYSNIKYGKHSAHEADLISRLKLLLKQCQS